MFYYYFYYPLFVCEHLDYFPPWIDDFFSMKFFELYYVLSVGFPTLSMQFLYFINYTLVPNGGLCDMNQPIVYLRTLGRVNLKVILSK